jgi:hypothetical protein
MWVEHPHNEDRILIVITAYEPDPELWEEDDTRRRS